MARRRIEDFARWWTSATEEARYETLLAAVEGRLSSPSLEEVRIAIILAETEAGQVAEG